MYLEHFGLDRPPFKITPDTSMFYSGSRRGAVLEALKYAITSGEGIIKVVGEVGSGKTMLCRMLEVELGPQVEIVYIANPSLSPENILHVIAFELKLGITSESTKLEVMQALQAYLLDKHASNRQVVVFVEEAQSMPIETLEEIRLLSNLETSDHKLLQMVLFGQPELDEKLREPSIRQLKERITHNFYLEPFPADDVYQYLNFRLRAVGYRGPDLFTSKLASNIERKSSGLTRRINILADKALLAAFSDGGHSIETRHIDMAAEDSDFGQADRWKPVARVAIAIFALGLAMFIGTLLPQAWQSTQLTAALPESMAVKPTASQTIRSESDRHSTAQGAAGSSVRQAASLNTTSETLGTEQTPLAVASQAPLNLNAHLQKSLSWAQTTPFNHFTIQMALIEIHAEPSLRQFVELASEHLDIEKLYIYQASIGGRMVFSVLYNDYEDKSDAIAQLSQLPDGLRNADPYLRTLKGIRSDITRTDRLAITTPEDIH